MKKFPTSISVAVWICGLALSSAAMAADTAVKIAARRGPSPLDGRQHAVYVQDKSTHPNGNAARRLQTATDGQQPMATVLSCSDSRVPVEIVFNQGIGDIFVVRVAGNVCGVDEMGSISMAWTTWALRCWSCWVTASAAP